MGRDLDKLQGTWFISSLELGGQPAPAAALSGAHITITRDRFESSGMGSTYSGTVVLGERKTPKTIDSVFTDGPETGNKNAGIYKITRDRWTLCLDTHGGKRPVRFASKAGTGIALQVLQKGDTTSTKSTKSTKSTTSTKSSKSSGPVSPLDGEWAMVSAVFNGAPMDAAMVAWARRSTGGGVTTVTAGPQVQLQARFTTDAAAAPRTIDYENIAGRHAGRKQAGIWKIDDGTLTICMSPPGKPRPKDFVSVKGDERSFTVWRRR